MCKLIQLSFICSDTLAESLSYLLKVLGKGVYFPNFQAVVGFTKMLADLFWLTNDEYKLLPIRRNVQFDLFLCKINNSQVLASGNRSDACVTLLPC